MEILTIEQIWDIEPTVGNQEELEGKQYMAVEDMLKQIDVDINHYGNCKEIYALARFRDAVKKLTHK